VAVPEHSAQLGIMLQIPRLSGHRLNRSLQGVKNMICPNCQSHLQTIHYEGIRIETCNKCSGEWLDEAEIGKIVRVREVKFDPDKRRAIAESTTITGVVLQDVDRDLQCPKCDGTTDAVNYGGDTGIIIDRCTTCRGIWLDADELENIQMVIEGWDDALTGDLQKYGPMLRDIAVDHDEADDVRISRLPLIGGFINSAINGILDVTS
jgi:Zn-finger nucleic acid-binding protein